MKMNRVSSIFMVTSLVCGIGFAQESTLSSHFLPTANSFLMTGGVAYSSGLLSLTSKDIQTTTKKIELGAQYSVMDSLALKLSIPALIQESMSTIKNITPVKSQASHTFIGRTEFGVDGKIVDTFIGELMGHMTAHLPTMAGYEANQGYEYLNFMSATTGISTIFDLPVYPGFLLASLSYTYKLPKTYNRVTMYFGSDMLASIGAGYDITPIASAALELGYMNTAPIKYEVGTLSKQSAQSMQTIRVNPSCVIDLDNTISIFANGSFLISRTEITEMDFQFKDLSPIFTGNLEDYSKMSLQMGVKVGLF